MKENEYASKVQKPESESPQTIEEARPQYAQTILFAEYPDVVGVEMFCEMLGIGRKLAYQLIQENRIPHIRIGRKYKIAKPDVIDFVLNRINENVNY